MKNELFQSAIFYEEPQVLLEDWNDKYARLIINPTPKTITEMRSNGTDEENKELEPVEITIWEARTLLVEKPYTYSTLIDALVKTKYSVSEELGILRQKDKKPGEWEEYNNFVEECKSIVKALNLIDEE